MVTVRVSSLGPLILLAPLIFVVHFLEEVPGFVAWFNAHVPRGITQPLFWSVNVAASPPLNHRNLRD
jgi:hypothetical protein